MVFMKMTNKKKLAAAIDHEHPCAGDNTCDIAKAVECGYFLWAARLLSGATECPETDEAALALSQEMGGENYEKTMEAERVLLLEENHRSCKACGSVLWVDNAEYATCDNCLEGSPAVGEEAQDEEE